MRMSYSQRCGAEYLIEISNMLMPLSMCSLGMQLILTVKGVLQQVGLLLQKFA